MKALRRWTRVLTVLLVVSGASLYGRAFYLHAKAGLAAALIRRAWETGLQTGRAQPPWSWADTHPIARMRIPKIGYDEIVLEGATPRTLAFGPARLRSAAQPGEPGNLIFAGHRTSWFEPLQAVHVNDVIELEWPDAHRAGSVQRRGYAVQLLRVANPENLSLLAPTSEDALTLVTCYPFGHGPSSPLRYLIRAYPIEDARSVPAQRSALD